MKRHFSRHYRQGTLDGLCGVYAVINALDLLCPELDSEELFQAVIREFAPSHPDIFSHGMTHRDLTKYVLRPTKRFCALHGQSLYVKITGGMRTLDTMWRAMQQHYDEHGAGSILLGMEYHWTCVRRVTSRSLVLADSSEYHRLCRAHLTVGDPRGKRRHYIEPTQTYLLSVQKSADLMSRPAKGGANHG